ncbi:NADP-dependent oxidoreductase [Paraburkholderia sp. MMS20-SJTN17]|uniref:NADP-dependent oxidoreductase n=1 Tax=Paraburkholderia translucens TaxID=2886945 RepID=A0ABS8K9P2_9BURK|nr:NADP-dependent oxidoreductase [Paraburkholderia sp. MMS20-SJTN17]MCC8401481.1 NADP-dependent oxidoreductase [Paraburkholderia sp. MMS20-SJTN17]
MPAPSSRQLLVGVRAAGLNPVDFKTRRGDLRVVQRYRLPVVLGNDLSGEVVACGDQVRRFRVGERVFACVARDTMGAFAQFAVVDEELAAVIPASIDFATAAAIPVAGLTALQALRDELHVSKGQRLFISGGAGGVGTFAIQLARRLGTQVATTASPRGEALVRQLGADLVIDYTRERPASVLSGFDGAFDLLGGDTLKQAFAIVRPGATVVSVAGMPEPDAASNGPGRGPGLQALFWIGSFSLRRCARRHGARYRYLFMHPSGPDLSELGRLVDANALEVVIDSVHSFEHIADAMAKLESGRAKGKIVVTMTDVP